MNDVDPNPNTKMPLVVQQPQQKTVSNLTCCQFHGKLIRKLTATEDSKTNKIKKKVCRDSNMGSPALLTTSPS